MKPRILLLALAVALPLFATLLSPAADAAPDAVFKASELLGKPTDTSVTVNVVPAQDVSLYYEYGSAPGAYSGRTADQAAKAGVASEVVISGLKANTQYYYRMQYQTAGSSDWTAHPEHSFHTQRPPGEAFTFTISADSHLDGLPPMGKQRYQQATLNIAKDRPDFHLDLGDAVGTDGVTTQAAVDERYMAQRDYFGNFADSAPLFLVLGNHENEEGWNFDDTPSLALMGLSARKQFYPTPVPDAFYTGNTDRLAAIGGDQLREDYYAFEWGDALFVAIDPFQYTMTNPYGAVAGEGADDPASGDQWNWTLGRQQYDWLKATLQNSHARYKFVFAHHVTGGQLRRQGAPAAYVRGGANAAPYFEWGGLNADGSYGFDTQRPGWGVPIHQLMVDNGVTAFFHGHDHQYAYEVYDGIVYQELPSPSMMGPGFNLYSENDPYTKKVLPNAGHLRVTVDSTRVTVDYVRAEVGQNAAGNGQVAFSYTIDAAKR